MQMSTDILAVPQHDCIYHSGRHQEYLLLSAGLLFQCEQPCLDCAGGPNEHFSVHNMQVEVYRQKAVLIILITM